MEKRRVPSIDNGYASAVTSWAEAADHPPRSMTCVCFAKRSSLGVTEPFLTQKTAVLLKVYRFMEPGRDMNPTVYVLTPLQSSGCFWTSLGILRSPMWLFSEKSKY